MSPNEVTCFWANRYAYEIGKISLEIFLRNTLDHIFSGTRHAEDELLNEADIIKWSGFNIVIAAIKICMIQQDFCPRAEILESLVQMLLQCKSITLDGLRALDDEGGGSILETPLLHQILVAMALQQGNRELVKAMTNATSPGPSCNLLFGAEHDQSIKLKFGTRTSSSHEAFKNQVDNGCDVWSSLIRAGWAVPRIYMKDWATSSTNIGAGIELLKILRERGVPIEVRDVKMVLWFGGNLTMLDLVLQLYIPDHGDPLSPSIEGWDAHELLKAAAKSKEGTEKLQILWNYRVFDINWLPEITPSNRIDSYSLTELMRNNDGQLQTPLHCAVGAGNAAAVEWLILKGARPELNDLGHNQYDLAKSLKRDDVIHVFEKYGWTLSEKEKSSNA